MSKSLKKKNVKYQEEFNTNNNNINLHEINNSSKRQIASMPQNKFRNGNNLSPMDFPTKNEQIKLPLINLNNNVKRVPNSYNFYQHLSDNVPKRFYSDQMKEDYNYKKIAKSNPLINRVNNVHKDKYLNQMQEYKIMNFNENRNIIGIEGKKYKKQNKEKIIEKNFSSEKIIKEEETIGKKRIKNNSSPKIYLKVSENEYIKFIEEQKIKINILEEKINQFARKEEELNKRILNLEKKKKCMLKK